MVSPPHPRHFYLSLSLSFVLQGLNDPNKIRQTLQTMKQIMLYFFLLLLDLLENIFSSLCSQSAVFPQNERRGCFGVFKQPQLAMHHLHGLRGLSLKLYT